MGIARLLAKGWIIFCLVAGAHALRISLASGVPLTPSLADIGICVILFTAMGLLFAGGFGVSAGLPGTPFRARLGLGHLPGDLRIERPGLRIFAPFGSTLLISILLSVLLTVLSWLGRR